MGWLGLSGPFRGRGDAIGEINTIMGDPEKKRPVVLPSLSLEVMIISSKRIGSH